MNPEDIKFSWLVPCGPMTEPIELEQCVSSIIREMRTGDELILVRDNEPQQYRCQFHWVDKFGPMTKGDMQGRAWPLECDRNPNVVTIDAGPDCNDCGKALNAGLIRAKNPYVIRQDADDWDLPGRRTFHLRQIMERPDAAAWGGGIRHCMKVGYETPRQAKNPSKPLIMEKDFQLILKELHVPLWHPATCFSVKALISVGGWPEGMRRCEDYGLFLRLFLAGAILHADADPVTMHRNARERRPESEVAAVRDMKVMALERMLRNEEPDPTSPRMKPFNWSLGRIEPYKAASKMSPVNECEEFAPPKYDPTKPQSIQPAKDDQKELDELNAFVEAAKRGEDVIIKDGKMVTVGVARMEAPGHEEKHEVDASTVTINGKQVPISELMQQVATEPPAEDPKPEPKKAKTRGNRRTSASRPSVSGQEDKPVDEPGSSSATSPDASF